ncbi:MAG: DUF2845 domain-containing protein [Proteobacteria bacterium]|nr:DUF2845 domain-containing protein [Pseudomonadota bacterium]
MSVGDHKDKVLAKCGEPDLVDWEGYYSAEAPRSQGPITLKGQTLQQARSQRLTIAVEKWTYNFGPNRFLQILTFEGAKLIGIEEGD